MIRVNIVCEGKTECEFVTKKLAPHLSDFGVYASAHNLGTGTNYARLEAKTIEWLKNEDLAYVTTLIDLYAMPNDFPGQTTAKGLRGRAKIEVLEAAFGEEIVRKMGSKFDTRRFVPHYQLHEFEALLFSAPKSWNNGWGLILRFPKAALDQSVTNLRRLNILTRSEHNRQQSVSNEFYPAIGKPCTAHWFSRNYHSAQCVRNVRILIVG
jgi:hypothetical protein